MYCPKFNISKIKFSNFEEDYNITISKELDDENNHK